MRPPIAPHRIAYVKKLLKSMSQRAAAIASGISLPIISEIAQGKRDESGRVDTPVGFQAVDPYTCPGCERLVTTAPCVACSAKRHDETKSKPEAAEEESARPTAETPRQADSREAPKRNSRRAHYRAGQPDR